MNPQGIFVIKGKENAVAQIEHLCKKYNLKNAANNVQSIAIFKASCQETISMLENVLLQKCKGPLAVNDL